MNAFPANTKKEDEFANIKEEINAPYKDILLTKDLLREILEVLEPCPIGPMATRVFRQHENQGLCWHDSLFTMLFESSATKPTIFGLLKELVDEMETKKMQTFQYIPIHINELAFALKARRKSEIEIGYWEMLVLALHRYILLGLLFLKEKEQNSSAVKVSKLKNRRESLQDIEFNSIHRKLKYSLYSEYKSGLCKSGILSFLTTMDFFLQELTNKTIGLERNTNPLKDSERVLGYYFSIEEKEKEKGAYYPPGLVYTLPNGTDYYFFGEAHILSIFSCKESWILYDNETGTAVLSDEQAEKVRTVGIESVQILATKTHYKYKLTFQDTSESIVMQEKVSEGMGEGEERVIRAVTVPSASCRMIQLPKEEKEQKGGGKKKRKQKTKKICRIKSQNPLRKN